MKLTKKTCKLIAELEYIIGSKCYNPKSYNGWTGESGCYYRYPVWIRDEKTDTEETRHKFKLDNINKDNINSMYYLFGPNHLWIGIGLYRVLEYLENYYGIDFNEMKKATKTKNESEK